MGIVPSWFFEHFPGGICYNKGFKYLINICFHEPQEDMHLKQHESFQVKST